MIVFLKLKNQHNRKYFLMSTFEWTLITIQESRKNTSADCKNDVLRSYFRGARRASFPGFKLWNFMYVNFSFHGAVISRTCSRNFTNFDENYRKLPKFYENYRNLPIFYES